MKKSPVETFGIRGGMLNGKGRARLGRPALGQGGFGAEAGHDGQGDAEKEEQRGEGCLLAAGPR